MFLFKRGAQINFLNIEMWLIYNFALVLGVQYDLYMYVLRDDHRNMFS